MNRSSFAVGVLSCIAAVGCDWTTSGSAWTVEALDTLDLPTVHVDSDQIEGLPRFDLGATMGPVDSLRVEGADERRDGIWTVETSGSHSAALVTDQGGTVLFLAVTEEDGPAVVDSVRVEGSTGFITAARSGSYWITPRRGLHLRILDEGSVADTLRVAGNRIVGVFDDGSMLIRDTPRGRRQRTSDYIERQTWTYELVSPTGDRQVPFLEGWRENVYRAGPSLPWWPGSAAAVAANRVWFSPRSGPEVIRIDRQGRPELRVTWESPLPEDGTAEVEAWRARRMSDAERMERDDPEAGRRYRLQVEGLVETWLNDRSYPAVEQLVGAHDGTLWIQERISRHREGRSDTRRWIALTEEGHPLAVLTHPPSYQILHFSQGHVWISRREDPLLLEIYAMPKLSSSSSRELSDKRSSVAGLRNAATDRFTQRSLSSRYVIESHG